MKTRSGQDRRKAPREELSDREIKDARIPWWKAIKLFIANLPLLAKLVMLVIGVMGGTIAAPEAYRMVDQLISDPLPTPEGSLPPPPKTETGMVSHIADSAFRAQAAQSFTAINNAINSHTEQIELLQQALQQVEARVSMQRAKGDSVVSERVTANEQRITQIEEIVQP